MGEAGGANVKQVLQARNGTTVVRNVPPPPCPPGSVLVRNAFSLISAGTERARVAQGQKSLLRRARERPDLVREVLSRTLREGPRATSATVRRKLVEEVAVGYSSAGVVMEVGEHVRGLVPGDRVACAGAGHANHAEVVSIPGNLCAPVPDAVSLESAAFATVAAIALHGIRLSDVDVGARVAVIGCGLVGQLVCRLLRAGGIETWAVDLDDARVAQALAGGADHGEVVDPDTAARVVGATGGIGVDAALITAAAPTSDPLLLGAELVRDRGAVVVVGDVPVQLPRGPLYGKELSLRVSRSYGPGRYDLEYEERGLDYPIGHVRWTEKRNIEAVLGLLARGSLSFEDLIEQVVPVDEASRAYARLLGEGQPLRGALLLAYGEATPVPEPSVVPERVLTPAPRRPLGAGAPVRIGLVGPGAFAANVLVPAFTAAGADLAVVGGGAGPSAEAASRTLGFARTAESAEAVVEDPEVDAVVVATRHGTHAELVERALHAGKHVFCEKPLVLSTDELERVLAAAESSSAILAVGFNRRFSPLLGDARKFLAASSRPLTAVYRVAAGHVPPESWVHDPAQGGGRALGEACHFVDSLAFLAGTPVRTVYAAGHGDDRSPLQSRDNLSVTLAFADGSVGALVYAAEGGAGVAKERLEAFTSGRTAVLDDYAALALYGADGIHRESRTQDKGHTGEVHAFLEAVRHGEQPVPLDELANVSLATLAIVESLRTGAPVVLKNAT